MIKKHFKFIMTITIISSLATPVFAIENTTYHSKSITLKNNIINKRATQESKKISQVIDEINQSVVAIIGKNSKVKDHNEIYSKFPTNLQHGSGVIITDNGQIITNNHVIDGLNDIYVVTYDGKVYKATLLYTDKLIDLALLKINKSNLKPIKFVDEKDVNVGDEVVAIGTPLSFGYRNSASLGIVSGLNRPVDMPYTFLQTDASINPGNSGGPLVNMDGKLVGINTLGSLFAQGMNFSIPIGNINYFLNHYNKFGKIKRCSTGIEFEENWAALLGLPTNQGLKVVTLQKNSVVTSSQIKDGDMLEAIDGKITTSIAQYNEILKSHLPYDTVKLTFSRDNKKFTISVQLKEEITCEKIN